MLLLRLLLGLNVTQPIKGGGSWGERDAERRGVDKEPNAALNISEHRGTTGAR